MTSLAAMFYLAALAFFVYGRQAGGTRRVVFFLGCIIAGILSFLSKENSFTLPVLLLVIECLFFSPGRAWTILKSIRWPYWILIALVLLALLPLLSHPWQVMVVRDYGVRHFNMPERLLTELRIVVFYISLLMLPLPGRLNLDHDIAVSTSLFAPPTTLLCLLFLLFLMGGAIFIRKKSPLVSLGIFWFFLNLVIESSVVPLELIFEHRLYLPSVGFFIAVVGILDWLALRISPGRSPDAKKILVLFVVILFALSSLMTTMRNDTWLDNLTLYRDCAEKSPDKGRAHSNYGLALAQQQKFDEALAAMERALELGQPQQEEYVNTAANIVTVYTKLDDYEEAIRRGEEYYNNMTPDMNMINFARFTLNLGAAYIHEKRFKDAFSVLMTGLRYYPSETLLHNTLTGLLFEASKDENGREELGLNGEPFDVYLTMAAIMSKVRQYELTEIFLNKAEEIDKENEKLRTYQDKLKKILAQNEFIQETINIENDTDYKNKPAFRRSLALASFIFDYYPPLRGTFLHWLLLRAAAISPANPHVNYMLARHLLLSGKTEQGVDLLEDIRTKHPDYTPAYVKLVSLYTRLGQTDKAAAISQQILDLYPGISEWRNYEDLVEGYKSGARIGIIRK